MKKQETYLTVNVDLVRQCCSPVKDPKKFNMNMLGSTEESSMYVYIKKLNVPETKDYLN